MKEVYKYRNKHEIIKVPKSPFLKSRMVRGYHTRIASRSILGKRRRTGYVTRPFKRRRLVKRSNQKVSTYGNRSDTVSSFRYKARRWSKRRWNRTLWNSTQQKPHFRVAAAWSDAQATPASRLLSRTVIFQAMDNGSAFWTAAGGAIDVDGGTMPIFNDDLVIRGGSVWCTITYVDSVTVLGDHVKCRLFLVRGAPNVNLSGFNSATRSASWDLTMFPEFKYTIGKVIMSKEFDLGSTQGDSRTIRYRLGVQKIDASAWSALQTGRLFWVLIMHNPATDDASNVNLTFGMSLSFTGDSVGTT